MVRPIQTTIEISASPAEVKKIFFDFPSYAIWHPSKTMILDFPPSNTTHSLAPGSKVAMTSGGATLHPVIVENSDEIFAWEGGFWPLLKAKHTFKFSRGETEGTTLLEQDEEFWGILTFLFADAWYGIMREKTEGRFVAFNTDLRTRVEAGRR